MWGDDNFNEHVWVEDSPYDVPAYWVVTGVIAASTTFALILIILQNKKARMPSLISIAVGNLLATLCIYLNIIHHFQTEWYLGATMCSVFLILRDVSASVQTFTFVVISVQNFVKMKKRFESFRTLPICLEDQDTSALVSRYQCFQFCVAWLSALCCSLALASTSQEACSLHVGNVFVDGSSRDDIGIRCLALGIVPYCITFLFLVSAAYLRFRTASSARTENHDGKLVLGFLVVFGLNNLSGYIMNLSIWPVHTRVTRVFVDHTMFFPMYQTSFCIPLLIYFVMPNVRNHFDKWFSCCSFDQENSNLESSEQGLIEVRRGQSQMWGPHPTPKVT